MRALSGFLHREYANLRISRRKRRLIEQLSSHFGRPVSLRRAGARGRDSVFVVKDKRGSVGALRLSNPHLRRNALRADMPFVVLGDAERLSREWHCFAVAGPAGITPSPLWRDSDALMCEFIAGPRLSDRLSQDPSSFWELLARASRILGSLHALGITHMDASLANTIDAGDGCRLIDFEYGPRVGLTLEQQMAYDHLRLLESSLKFMPHGERDRVDSWLEVLHAVLPERAREADTSPLVPAISRVLACQDLIHPLATVFPSMDQRI
ncbi:MAG: hypothetical protein OXU19_06895 [bacterium]|nr:hypothetical protein [bacterium]MDE0241469.1 hypothetical protein [bacterium]MDE0415460.1 hypothetical protein [bacterium]